MNEKQLKQAIGEKWDTFLELSPEFNEAYQELPTHAYKNGQLDSKTKRLMALCSALCTGCTGCILFQTQRAIDLGATVEEVHETCQVAVSLGGTMAAAQCTKVIGYLKETGVLG